MTDGKSVIFSFPIRSKTKTSAEFSRFCRGVGIPNSIKSDNERKIIGKDTNFQKQCRYYHIKTSTIEPYSPLQNRAENMIRILRAKHKARKAKMRFPVVLWDFPLIWEYQIYNQTARKN